MRLAVKWCLIAELKDSLGLLYPPNQVIYTNAFTDVRADVRYTYTKAGFEQDVILREQPPSPEAYGFDPATTKLEFTRSFSILPALWKLPLPRRRTRRRTRSWILRGQDRARQGVSREQRPVASCWRSNGQELGGVEGRTF